jgi:hypothetical protein
MEVMAMNRFCIIYVLIPAAGAAAILWVTS